MDSKIMDSPRRSGLRSGPKPRGGQVSYSHFKLTRGCDGIAWPYCSDAKGASAKTRCRHDVIAQLDDRARALRGGVVHGDLVHSLGKEIRAFMPAPMSKNSAGPPTIAPS